MAGYQNTCAAVGYDMIVCRVVARNESHGSVTFIAWELGWLVR